MQTIKQRLSDLVILDGLAMAAAMDDLQAGAGTRVVDLVGDLDCSLGRVSTNQERRLLIVRYRRWCNSLQNLRRVRAVAA